MDKPVLAFVIPVYGAFKYAMLAVETALANTTRYKPLVVLVDDCSPVDPEGKYTFKDVVNAGKLIAPDGVVEIRHTMNHGLTVSWNNGIAEALSNKAQVICVTNSDVMFPEDWDRHLAAALKERALIGPMTNTPGTEATQHIKHVLPTVDSGNRVNRNAIQAALSAKPLEIMPGPINGFCMFAEAVTWATNAYNADSSAYFRPSNPVNSQGQPNPTPNMTLQEYELQRRWIKRGLYAGICRNIFVYHFRSATRGPKYLRGDWATLS